MPFVTDTMNPHGRAAQVMQAEIDRLSDPRRAQNMLRIMHSLDEITSVLSREEAIAFHADPMGEAIRMDPDTWAEVHALIEQRQK
ncbi:MAG: hypothetical protein RI571_06455 [Roseovarius sp.]|nr:hypothetical protein [Roseovarius sp.]